MNPALTRGIAAASLAAVLAAAPAGFAQTAPAAPGDRGSHAQQMQRPDPEAMAARRAERLRSVLQLRPDQEGALKAFLDAVKRPASSHEGFRQQRHEMAALTTPQRLERRKAMMAERQARFERRAAATLRFYAQLSPAQQKALGAERRGKWGGGRRGGFHHGGMEDHAG